MQNAQPIAESTSAVSGATTNYGDRYRALVEASPLCIHEIDRQGRFAGINPAGQRMLCARCEGEVVGRHYLDVVADFDRERIAGLMEDAFQGRASRFEFAGATEELSFYTSSFVPLYENGEIVRLMGVSENITERRLMAMEMARNEARFAALFENLPTPTLVLARHTGRVLMLNRAFERMTGYREEQLRGRLFAELDLWDDGSSEGILASDQGEMELELRDIDGAVHQVRAEARTLVLDREPAVIVQLRPDPVPGAKREIVRGTEHGQHREESV